MLDEILLNAEDRMEKVISIMREDFATIRAGRASVSLLDKVEVDYYGAMTPINQTANISAPEARLLVVQPWDKNMMGAIEKAIQKSDLGLNPSNDGCVIRIAIPQLTEERRKELVKLVSKKAEDSKVAVRNIRRDANDSIKSLEKKKEASEDECANALTDIQDATDKYIKRIDEVAAKKEAEIMEV